MNLKKFVECLTAEERTELSAALNEMERKQELGRFREGKHSPLASEEKALVQRGRFVDAIKAYRERTGETLLFSKLVVDDFSLRGV